ncbi:Transcriptional regulator, RpiR family [Alkalibacterium sp. AK22]|uniref:MurR/RpiR family transcriptional regulator n=1 Tax=Alkalibacterium sp. AK22 TaxID=1229520 RepID=UPI000452B502|nr:MurR/RpiR family transcriptional regulator [Alkalibacterium sp. AK22]EXJ23889.1 Transcriptional regulator, RpiR family [Alkalibacterium sp. AK22]
MNFYEKLESNRKRLNDNENTILNYLLDHKEQLSEMTIREVAGHFYTSPNTIVRLTQKLDFSGYQEFKDQLKKVLSVQKSVGELYSLDDRIIKTKQLINPDIVQQMIQAIHKADTILLFAVGLSRFPAEEFSQRLQIVGKHSQTFIDPHIMKYNAQLLGKNDLAIAVSVSGSQSSNVYAAASRAKVAGAQTISVTGFSSNALANLTDYQLYGYSSPIKINAIDATDRFSIHYLTNYLYNQYIEQYYDIETSHS